LITQDSSVQPYFFGSSASPLFGIYHPPNSGDLNDKAVLLCYPIGHEYMRIHFVYRRLARLLSDAGCHVFRFDYFGIGDSAGESGDGDVDRWKLDICSAAQELRDISRATKISLVGVRFGATLAALTSVDLLSVHELVLWDPVVSGRKYIEELRLINDNMGYFFKSTKQEDNFDELMGYPFPPGLRKGIEEINLTTIPKYKSTKIVLITSENKEVYLQLRNKFEADNIYFEHHSVSDAHEWGKPENFNKTVLVNETLHKIRAVIVEEPG